MSIAEQIAAKRADLALFVTESAQVLAEPMTEEACGLVALDPLKLMVASGLTAAPAGTMIDITPNKQAITHAAPAAPPPTVRAEPPAAEIVAALKPAKHRGRSCSFTDALVILLREPSLTIDAGTLRMLAAQNGGGEGARSGRPMGEGVSRVSPVETVENGWTPAFRDISSRLMSEE